MNDCADRGPSKWSAAAIRWCGYALLVLAIACAAAPARAASDEVDSKGAPIPSIATSLPGNGDPGGVRKWLYERGLTYSFVLTSEILGDVAGGMRRGAVFQGKLETIVRADLEKMFGLRGLSFFTNSFLIHNTGGIRRDYVGSFNTISNIEALSTMRLSELWLEQKLGDTFNVRFGQLAADAEFFIASYSDFLMTSDWPSIKAQTLPSGGPAYPLSTPGIRLKYESPEKQTVFLLALFNGDPAGPGPEDAQIKNRYGLNFRVQDPPLLMGEAQYKYNQDKEATGLAGIWRLGFWHHFGEFDNQRYDAKGLSLADPLSSGIPAKLRGSTGIYGIVDHQLYRPPGGAPDSGIAMFTRAGFTAPDRNPVDVYIDGGLIFSGMLPGRPDDKIAGTFLYSHISRDAAALDRDRIFFTGMPHPIRDYELNLALVYHAQIVPGWTIQPAFHYVLHPGGHVPDPNSPVPQTAIKDAAVFAVRSVITY
ncbi:MAG: porin [Hyphomicrobiales bacterium]|jgi:porin|nr:porin [Hyphomicrobiales bacterium]